MNIVEKIRKDFEIFIIDTFDTLGEEASDLLIWDAKKQHYVSEPVQTLWHGFRVGALQREKKLITYDNFLNEVGSLLGITHPTFDNVKSSVKFYVETKR